MEIIRHLQSPGWDLKLGQQSLVIHAPDELAANELIEAAFDQLALAANNLRFKGVEIRLLQQQSVLDHSYEAMLLYIRAHFNSTFEVIKFGHPKRLKRLVTIHHYEPIRRPVIA